LAANARRTRTYVFPNDNDGTTTNETSRVETSVEGLKTMRTSFGLVSTTIKTVPSGGSWTVTETMPDNSKVISSYQNSRLATVTRKDSNNAQIAQTTYSYDPHGRLLSTTDARSGTTSYIYDSMDRVTLVITPAPGNGQSVQTTSS